MTTPALLRKVAEAVRDECGAMADGGEGVGPRIQGIDLDAIIASVLAANPPLAAPTCDVSAHAMRHVLAQLVSMVDAAIAAAEGSR